MQYPGFVGGNYVAQSPLAAAQQVINFYPELTAAPSRSPGAYYPTPGMSTLIQFPFANEIGRAAFTVNGRTWFVMGGGVYEIFANPSAVQRGAVPYDNLQAQIAYNGSIGNQLCIASGGQLTYLDLATNVMIAVSGVTFTNPIQVGAIDGFLVALDVGQNRLYVSPLNDAGAVWDPTQFIQRTTQPDMWRALAIVPPNIWAIGELTGDVLFDAGTSPFPLAPRPGITFRYGTHAPFSVATIGDSVLWLATDKDGAGVVVQTVGYSPTPISDKALEFEIATWQREFGIDDAEAFVYKENGHQYYVLQFPSVPATRVYDTSTRLWHKRGTWNYSTGSYDLWAPRVCTSAFGKHLVAMNVATSSSGFIAEMSTNIFTEYTGNVIRRVIIPPPLWSDSRSKRLFIRRLELILEPGTATISGIPQVMLRTSRDTKTWSNERRCGAGAMGEYGTRVFWLQNGSSTMLFQPEFVFSDYVPWRVIGAEFDGSGVMSGAGS